MLLPYVVSASVPPDRLSVNVPRPPCSTPFPYTTLFRSVVGVTVSSSWIVNVDLARNVDTGSLELRWTIKPKVSSGSAADSSEIDTLIDCVARPLVELITRLLLPVYSLLLL